MTLRIIYPRLLEENPNKLTKFKSDMGDRLRIATENGATYEIFSNTPIPESVKQWLTLTDIIYKQWNQFLRKLIRTIIIGAVSHNSRQDRKSVV